jgi:hypothetical protein
MKIGNSEQPAHSKWRSLAYNTILISGWIRKFIAKAARNCVTYYEVVPEERIARNIGLQKKELALSFIE